MGSSTPAPLFLYKPDDGELVDVDVHLGDNYDKLNDWAAAVDDIPTGKLWRTAGFTGALDAAGEAIEFDASRVTNAVATGANGDGLVVPSSGMYDVIIHGYGSGGGTSAIVRFAAVRIRAATADKVVSAVSMSKINGNDVEGSSLDNVPLAGGDEIRLTGSASDSAVNGYGIDEVTGIRLTVRKTGELNGATPI